jgi:lysophospholipase L1-like esterase
MSIRSTLVLTIIFAFSSGIAGAGEEPTPITPVPKNDKADWMQKHAAYVAEAKKGNIPLVMLGDSITDFWSTNGKDVWEKNYAPLHVANFGIAADKVENILWRVENGEFDGITPKVVVLLGGINNTWAVKRGEWEKSGAQIAGGLKQIIAAIQAKSPKTKVLLLAVFPMADGIDATVKSINANLAKLDNGSTIRFLDIGPKLADADGRVSKEVMADGLHPTAKGYQIWADAMRPMLNDMMK